MKSKPEKSAEVQQGLLVNVARTIGSTLGALAAKTGSVPSRHVRPRLVKKKRRAKPAKLRPRRSV
jgi:hypothetical protein